MKVFYSNAERSVIDTVRKDGRSQIGGSTLEELRTRYPDTEVIDIDDAIDRVDAAYRKPPARITRERFWQMLEVLPPDEWVSGINSESFKLSERTAGSITQIFCRIGDDYWELSDSFTLRHSKILELVRAASTGVPS